MCSGRVDLEFIFRAFLNALDGVFIGGCRLNECNYATQGNFDALGNVYLGRKIMGHIGLNPERLRIAFMSSGDGILLAEEIHDFTQTVQRLGPLGKEKNIEEKELKIKIESVISLIPYIRLVERERLRMPAKSEEAYHRFFTSETFEDLFHELIADKLAIGQMTLLLRERPCSTGEICRMIRLDPSDVSRHIHHASRQGWIRYDESRQGYTLMLHKSCL